MGHEITKTVSVNDISMAEGAEQLTTAALPRMPTTNEIKKEPL